MSENNSLNNIALALNQLARMQAFSLINDETWKAKPNKEKIILLYQFGFTNEEIALAIGTTEGTVKKEISISKKGDK